jgi:hypothetical protein
MIEIKHYSKENKEIWDAFVSKSKNSTFLFYRDFMDYHSHKFEDYSLIIYDNNKVVGLLPANKVSEDQISSHSGLSYGGFIFDKNARLIEILRIVYETLKFCKNSNINKIIYKSFPIFYNSVGSDEVDYSFFLINAKLIRRDCALVINLNDKVPIQARRMRSIKKAQKAGIIIEEVNRFDDFWNEILTPNLLSRYGVKPVHTLDEIKSLAKSFPTNIRQFNAYMNGVIIAGTTIFETTNVAHAQYISANIDGRNTGALDFLFYELIEHVFEHKNYFDFGISNENNGLTINYGLLDWKEGFGGRTFSHDFFEIETCNYVKLKTI